MYYVIWNSRDKIVSKSPNSPKVLPPIVHSLDSAKTQKRTLNGNLEVMHLAPRGGGLVVGIPLSEHRKEITAFGIKLFGSTVLVLILGLGTGWWMLGRETRQLTQIAEASQKIAYGNLSERINIEGTSHEVASLVSVLNDSFTRLEHSFEQQVRFTADVSHELRTPVSIILSKGQFVLSKKRTPEEYQNAIATCIDSATHMKRMIESLLELARYDSGEITLNRKVTTVSTIVSDSVELLQTLANQKQITLTTALDDSTANIDPHRFQQVCIILISNAIKHSPIGTEIRMRTYRDNQDCLVTVSDNGLGIDEKELPFLFERFFRGKQSYGEPKENTGLGLAITKAIIVAHGGSIHAENKPNGGAIFYVRIPVANEV
ncbi:ATP-binding protein [Puniceicoccaceae bacterium K14]|nr:ATP-binding protein [Puniceicoccaceae bacterium K14]